MIQWKSYNGCEQKTLTWEESEKLGINPQGQILWANLNEMVQNNVQYHKFSTQYAPLKFLKLEYFAGRTAMMPVHKHMEIIVTQTPSYMLLILVGDTIEARAIVLRFQQWKLKVQEGKAYYIE